MTWFRVDDGMPEHAKLASLEAKPRLWADALALWLSAGCFCARTLTDGRVPKTALRKLVPFPPKPAADALVKCGLWTDAKDHYQFHDWTDYQPTAEEVRQDRAAARDRMKRVRANRRARSAERSRERSGEVRDPDPIPTRPDPDPIDLDHLVDVHEGSVSAAAPESVGGSSFWRKVGAAWASVFEQATGRAFSVGAQEPAFLAMATLSRRDAGGDEEQALALVWKVAEATFEPPSWWTDPAKKRNGRPPDPAFTVRHWSTLLAKAAPRKGNGRPAPTDPVSIARAEYEAKVAELDRALPGTPDHERLDGEARDLAAHLRALEKRRTSPRSTGPESAGAILAARRPKP